MATKERARAIIRASQPPFTTSSMAIDKLKSLISVHVHNLAELDVPPLEASSILTRAGLISNVRAAALKGSGLALDRRRHDGRGGARREWGQHPRALPSTRVSSMFPLIAHKSSTQLAYKSTVRGSTQIWRHIALGQARRSDDHGSVRPLTF